MRRLTHLRRRWAIWSAGYYPPAEGARPTIILEPGRAITSSAQTLRFASSRQPRAGANDAVITDGGKNVAFPTGYEHHEMQAASKLRLPATKNLRRIRAALPSG